MLVVSCLSPTCCACACASYFVCLLGTAENVCFLFGHVNYHVNWSGVEGMITFLEVAHMLNATQIV